MGDLRLKIVCKYYTNFSQTRDVRGMHKRRLFCYASQGITSRYGAKTEDYSELDLEELFTVPGGLKKFLESQNHVKKYQFLEAFFRYILLLLHSEVGQLAVVTERKRKDQIKNLERELRILLTILGDSSFWLCDDKHKKFQKLRAKFEAVAIEAASVVCSLVYSSRQVAPDSSPPVFECILRDPALTKQKDDFDVVLNHFHLLKTNIMKSLDLLSCVSRSAYVTPNTSVVDSLLIVDSLICDLEDLMNREDNPIAGVRDQIKRLHQGLHVMQSSIKDIGSSQSSKIGELKEPLMQTGDMAYAAEYLVTSFLVGYAPLWYLIPRLVNINDKIEHIESELIEITKKYKSGGLKVAEYFSTRLTLQAKENTEVDDVTVGFEDNATHILELLVGGTERLQVISIFGMPGLGKTTLAKILYNHPSVTYFFDKLSWCVISQTYQRQGTLTDILMNLTTELGKHRFLKMEEESLFEHIYKSLKGRRYLIVMDDIWDSNVWDDLQRCFPDDENGSRILFTSRNKDVAPPNSIIYAQPSLSKDQCWELLEKKVFHNKPCPVELRRIGKEIAENCCGLPLAVVVIAGILSNVDRKRSTWEEVGGNLASYIFHGGDNSSVMQILKLSYKYLSDHLKPCFLYFGAFQEDKDIPARKIMRLWIAEGFIRKEEEKSPDDVAEEYLRELISKSLVMVAKRRSDGGVKSCTVHDLLRDLCLRICEEDNFLKLEMSKIEEDNFPEPETNIMFPKRGNWGRDLGDSATWSYCQHMRSFRGSSLTTRLYVGDMRLLRILDSNSIFDQLIGIEYLVNLRYLVISVDLLASIGGLVNLEYLSVEPKTLDAIYLPPAIVKMRKLRYIHVLKSTAKYDKDCDSSRPNNLEYLSGIRIGELKDEEMLKCSPHLRKLKCRYKHFDQMWMEVTTCPHFDLRFLTRLDSLNLTFDHHPGLRILEEFGFPSNIRKLTLSLSGFHWRMSTIGRLENLEVLKLYRVCFMGARWDTIDGEFQKLRFLKIDYTNLTQWNVASSQHFPKLQQLILKDCYNLQEIPCEIGEIATLQLIEVKGIRKKSVVESAQRIKQEQCEDFGNEELRVIIDVY